MYRRGDRTLDPEDQLQIFIAGVQRNCDIADAQFAGDDALCVYLLKMRDYFRWAEHQPLHQPVERSALGDWISAKEAQWDELEEAPFESLILLSEEVHWFDNERINQVLVPLGYVYSGGLGRRSRPHFFIGRLAAMELAGENRIYITGTELARGVSALPAMSQAGAIHVRQDALKRYLASMVEEWSWKKQKNAMGRVVEHYRFDDDADAALDAMVAHQQENLILHEIGEQVAGEMIGEHWQRLIGGFDDPIDEIRARAVRDNLADCVTSLPAFLALEDEVSLDFYYANMTPLRREMFPSFCSAYKAARGSGDFSQMAEVVCRARRHWLNISRRLLGGPASDQHRRTALLESCAF